MVFGSSDWVCLLVSLIIILRRSYQYQPQKSQLPHPPSRSRSALANTISRSLLNKTGWTMKCLQFACRFVSFPIYSVYSLQFRLNCFCCIGHHFPFLPAISIDLNAFSLHQPEAWAERSTRDKVPNTNVKRMQIVLTSTTGAIRGDDSPAPLSSHFQPTIESYLTLALDQLLTPTRGGLHHSRPLSLFVCS